VLRPLAEAQAEVRRFCQDHSNWIVEGCYATLVSTTLKYQPKLLFLNPGPLACQENCRARPWEPHSSLRLRNKRPTSRPCFNG
jgi:hypothetical protein